MYPILKREKAEIPSSGPTKDKSPGWEAKGAGGGVGRGTVSGSSILCCSVDVPPSKATPVQKPCQGVLLTH